MADQTSNVNISTTTTLTTTIQHHTHTTIHTLSYYNTILAGASRFLVGEDATVRCCLPIRSIHHLFFFPFNNAFTQTFPFITLYSFSLIHLLMYLIVFVFISALCLFVVLSIQICFRFLRFVFPLSFPFSFLSFSPSTTRTLLEPFSCSRVLVVKVRSI